MERPLPELALRIARIDERKHRGTTAVEVAGLVDQRVRQPVRVAELVRRHRLEIDRARHRVERVVADREAVAVGRFRIELHVVVENRSSPVEAGGKLQVTIAIRIGSTGNAGRNVTVPVLVDVVAVQEGGVGNQLD